MKKYFKTKTSDVKENPFDLLGERDLVKNDGNLEDFYTCNVKGELLNRLTLSDFIDNGIDFIQKETKNKGKSGGSAKIGSSGGCAQIGSSGGWAKIKVDGKKSIAFACGEHSIIRAKKRNLDFTSRIRWCF